MEKSNENKLNQQDSNLKNQGQNFSSIPSQSSNRNLKIVVGVLIVLLVGALGVVGYYDFINNKDISQTEQLAPTNNQNVSQTTETPNSQSGHLPVVIYMQQVKTISNGSRTWPTVKILRKVGNEEPEILAEVGKVGEYPNNFKLSPDNKFLLVNLESKLQILNLTTKELKDLFIPKRQVLSVSYSPDEKQLFIWDQKYAPTDGNNSYYVHLFTLADQKDQIIKQGSNASAFFGSVWRNDNKVILNEALGEFSRPWYFDLNNNQMFKTMVDFASGFTSESGKAMAVVKDSVVDVCNDFSGSASSVYNIIDPVSGNILGTIGGSGNRVSVLAISSDDEEAVYQAEKPWTNRDDCSKTPERNYYKVQISSGKVTKLSNVADVLKSWNVNYVGATAEYDYNKSTWSIFINGQPIITSDKELRLVGQFFN
ncbi:MAG: hypothetical protein PHW92_15450 [Lutibacter sp.]|nr:hypothetical protein [Lutibacter sp.]